MNSELYNTSRNSGVSSNYGSLRSNNRAKIENNDKLLINTLSYNNEQKNYSIATAKISVTDENNYLLPENKASLSTFQKTNKLADLLRQNNFSNTNRNVNSTIGLSLPHKTNNNLPNRALSFTNRTFSIANKHELNKQNTIETENIDKLNILNVKQNNEIKKIDNKLNENIISNIVCDMNKPNLPARTSSLRPYDIITQNNGSYNSASYVKNFNSPIGTFTEIYNSNECTDNDVLKIESCYKSMGSRVFACKSLADLYSINIKDLMNLSDWKHQSTGMPVWIFNTGLNPKRKKSLVFVLADRLTGFALRKIDSVTFLNDFKWAKKNLLTFRVIDEFDDYLNVNNNGDIKSLDRKKLHSTKSSMSLKSVGKLKSESTNNNNNQNLYALEFKNDFECSRFYDYFRTIAYDVKNQDLFDVNYKPKKRERIRIFCRRITKAAISQPCAFQHVNSVPNLTLTNAFSDGGSVRSTNTTNANDDFSQFDFNIDELQSRNGENYDYGDDDDEF